MKQEEPNIKEQLQLLAIMGICVLMGMLLGVLLYNHETQLSSQSFYFENLGNGNYQLFSWGNNSTLHTNIKINSYVGQCQKLSFHVDIITGTVSANIQNVTQDYCGAKYLP